MSRERSVVYLCHARPPRQCTSLMAKCAWPLWHRVREFKKKEYKRLANLVERAKTLDPRIIRDKERERIR